jgi:hypothetical protein
MTSKAELASNQPTIAQLQQVASGELITAEVENANNLLNLNAIILAYNWIIENGADTSLENIFTIAQQFAVGLKTNLIESLTTNANITINNGTGGIYKNSITANNKILTASEVAALITTGSDVVDRDYGDITVTDSGLTWTIDPNAVTQSKIGYTFTTISSNTTATNNTYYLCDTSGGAFTLTFPSSASAGHKIYIADLEGTFNTNRLTVARNGLNIENQATDLVLDIKNFTGTFYYVDATIGWKRI